MEIIAFHMNKKNSSSDSDHPQEHTHQPAPHDRGRGRGGGVEDTMGEGVRPKQHYIWSQANRPLVNNQLPPTEEKNPTKRCRIWCKNGVHGETRYICKSCAVPLHKAKCFKTYHSNKQYYDQE